MRPDAPARPEQTKFPRTANEATRIAHLWFTSRPAATLADWRDHFLSLHLAGVPAYDGQERAARADVWRDAFAAGVAAAIIGSACHA
ncbi:hypothetical protein [Kerstersia similis]|uniref:hypothetical protein n=1 Tax=Kerstersia similis TaxID=206505 RepID=UPI0039EE01C3